MRNLKCNGLKNVGFIDLSKIKPIEMKDVIYLELPENSININGKMWNDSFLTCENVDNLKFENIASMVV